MSVTHLLTKPTTAKPIRYGDLRTRVVRQGQHIVVQDWTKDPSVVQSLIVTVNAAIEAKAAGRK